MVHTYVDIDNVAPLYQTLRRRYGKGMVTVNSAFQGDANGSKSPASGSSWRAKLNSVVVRQIDKVSVRILICLPSTLANETGPRKEC